MLVGPFTNLPSLSPPVHCTVPLLLSPHWNSPLPLSPEGTVLLPLTPLLQFPCLSNSIGIVHLPLSPHRYSSPAFLTPSIQFPCLSHPIGTAPLPLLTLSDSALPLSPSVNQSPVHLTPI
jgi:hypothetical protein